MTNLSKQKKLASKVTGVGTERVKIDQSMAEEIKEAITREDIRALISNGAIEILPAQGISRHRARERHEQKKKGRRRGPGLRRGKAGAREPTHRKWINKIRSLRAHLMELREKKILDPKTYRELYMRAKGGFFRDMGHLKIYLKQRDMKKEAAK